MHILVTGGAGFIGSNLTHTFVSQGHQVTVVDDLSTGSMEKIETVMDKIRFVEADIADLDLMIEVMNGVDVVFHEAALPSVPRSIDDPWKTNHHNTNGTLSVLIAAEKTGVGRVVGAASSSAYGNTPTLPKVETMPSIPMSPYAVSKYVGEMYANVFYRVYGLETVMLRYFNVFGPRQDPDSPYSAVIPKFMALMLDGKSPSIHGDGEQTRDFTYIDNVIQANIKAATAPARQVAGRVFNVGCGDRVSLNDLMTALNNVMGTQIQAQYSEKRAGDVRDSQADIAAAREAFGYDPTISLEEGLTRTLAWLKESRQ